MNTFIDEQTAANAGIVKIKPVNTTTVQAVKCAQNLVNSYKLRLLSMIDIEEYDKQALILFNEVLKKDNLSGISVIIVSHIFPDKIAFLKAISSAVHVACLIPKSINSHALKYLEENTKLPILNISRSDLLKKEIINVILRNVPENNKLIILDIGGYFSDVSCLLYQSLGDRFLGVIEDTENGHQKYLKKKGAYNYFSVARSPLKETEDFLIGKSIVFSADSILRNNSQLLVNKKVLVIGYGKIGKSIANSISSQNGYVSIYDNNPILMAQAKSHGYEIHEKIFSLQSADVIFCATGNKSLEYEDLLHIKNMSFIVSVTSSDDEFDGLFDNLELSKHPYDKSISVLYIPSKEKVIYIMNNGNAVNFQHGAVVGSYIYLVQLEIVFSMVRLIQSSKLEKVQYITNEDRCEIARKWLNIYG